MIDQVIIQSTADTSQAEQEYVGLRKEIKNLKAELDLLDEGTAEYDATFTKLSNKMKQQQDRTKALRSSSADLGDVFSNTSKVIGGVAQGFAGATAALSLFGVENEQLLKTIQKVQAFEAIGRSFTGLEETITKTLPALKNNIMAFFKDTSKMKINVGVDAGVTGNVQQGAVQTIDTEAFEKAAESSERMAQAQQGAAGAMNSNAGTSKALLETETQTLNIQIEQNKESIKNNIAKLQQLEIEKNIALENVKQIDLEANNICESLIDKINRDGLGNWSDDINAEEISGLQKKYQENQSILVETEKSLKNTTDELTAQKNKLTELESAQQKLNKTTTGFGKIWGQMKGILTGVGIAAAITLIIAGFTYIIKQIQEANAKIKEFYENRVKFNEELSKSIESSGGKELAMLKTLQVGYNKLSGDKKKQQKFLEDNKDSYKKIGIEIDKLPNKEGALTKAIAKTNDVLIERARNMGRVNLLMTKFGEQFDLQTKKELAQADIRKFLPKEGALSVFEMENKGLMDYIASVYAGGTRNAENIANMVIKNFPNLKPKFDGLVDTFEMINSKYGDFIKNTNTNAVQLNNVNKQIGELSKGIQPFNLEDNNNGAAGATTVVKSYNELLQETLNLYQGLNLNNPFTPERIRQIESQFENVKTIADRTVFEIANNEALSDEEKLRRISDVNQTIIAAERTKILALKQISLDNAKWERDNQLRALKEQAAIQKNNYKQTIEDAKKSLEKGSISQSKFDEIFNKVQVAAGTAFKSVKEFYKYLGGNEVVNRNDKFINGVSDVANSFKTVTDGVESFDSEGFKKKIKDLYNVDLDVTNPLDVDLGKLSVDEFNFLQQLIKQYQDYNNTVQGIQIQANADTKANTEKNYAEQLNLINKQFAEIESEYDKYQSRLRTQINDNSNISFMDFITGNKSGYQNREDVIKGLEADIELENQRQESIKKTIQTKQDELLNQNITLEERAKINEELKQLDVDLTSSEETESEKRLSIAEKEKEKRKEIFDATVQGLEDVTTIMSNIYEANETNELNNLKRLLKSKAITQEQYEERSEALANEYAKKRQRIEIFQGLLAATSSSIGAFSSAMRPDSGIPYPYNLIAAGISSAAAFSAVIAQVATLRGLSVGDTSSTPVQSTAGTGLNYTLQEQQVSNERLLNSLTNQRVYVLESDITSTQARVSEVQAMSIF